MRPKQPELWVTIHNPNTPEDTVKLLGRWYAESLFQMVHDPQNAGKTIDEIIASKKSVFG